MRADRPVTTLLLFLQTRGRVTVAEVAASAEATADPVVRPDISISPRPSGQDPQDARTRALPGLARLAGTRVFGLAPV
ncbi:hypothetical protein OG883_15725 [Streptomyces sp. NBC_01142]|uniref:hypothetical protein n=1 Tax=Streptomyces sp. NBC_01142 TaxID=2975865 RepID=UPI0022506544|nr:hypothetical protein [Streptomyces sp. NBC_01142]MCX4821330.1 hypothetical protein [Streptomyces sp. NBC_01142]